MSGKNYKLAKMRGMERRKEGEKDKEQKSDQVAQREGLAWAEVCVSSTACTPPPSAIPLNACSPVQQHGHHPRTYYRGSNFGPSLALLIKIYVWSKIPGLFLISDLCRLAGVFICCWVSGVTTAECSPTTLHYTHTHTTWCSLNLSVIFLN